jgi:hypothetical protein
MNHTFVNVLVCVAVYSAISVPLLIGAAFLLFPTHPSGRKGKSTLEVDGCGHVYPSGIYLE